MNKPVKVITEKQDAVTTINRPGVRNAVDYETAQLLKGAFLEFESDNSQSS